MINAKIIFFSLMVCSCSAPLSESSWSVLLTTCILILPDCFVLYPPTSFFNSFSSVGKVNNVWAVLNVWDATEKNSSKTTLLFSLRAAPKPIHNWKSTVLLVSIELYFSRCCRVIACVVLCHPWLPLVCVGSTTFSCLILCSFDLYWCWLYAVIDTGDESKRSNNKNSFPYPLYVRLQSLLLKRSSKSIRYSRKSGKSTSGQILAVQRRLFPVLIPSLMGFDRPRREVVVLWPPSISGFIIGFWEV